MSADRKRYVYVFLVNITVVTLLIVLAEGAARLFAHTETSALFSDPDLRLRGRPFLEHHPTRGFALIPLFDKYSVAINRDGFRGSELPNDLGDRFLVLALGDSTTFGWRVKNGEDYPSYLMGFLKQDRDDVYVINGGVPSYTSSQVLLYLNELLNKFDPAVVLINIMWNDIVYSTVANWYPQLLIHQRPPEWMSFLLTHSMLFRHLVLNRTQDESSVDAFNQEALLQYRNNISEMIRTCQSHGVYLAFVHPPFEGSHMPEAGLKEFQVRYSKRFFVETAHRYANELLAIATERDVPVIEHRLGINSPHEASLFMDLLHPTAEGNYIMAEDIHRHIVRESRLGG